MDIVRNRKIATETRDSIRRKKGFQMFIAVQTVFSLILMQIIAIGIFGLKKLPLASSFCVPLPVLTLIFNDYRRTRFLLIFQDYSAEGIEPMTSLGLSPKEVALFLSNQHMLSILRAMQSLIKKDRDDQNDPSMAEFLDELVTAYRDPALMLIQYSGRSDRNTSLLHTVEV
ncbi:hypothetical protein HYC85_005727 [Camellia sinensis]|uniref:Uncharacterized protein n=1 Tax=Camellia sinensis TaxID=4442 RepID=A0A7J7I0A6_CAMSI|nr:hypothetical protein HYC85_005727 [Camellia sinensis]